MYKESSPWSFINMYGKFSTKTKYKEFKENHETYYHQNDKNKGIELSSFIFFFLKDWAVLVLGLNQ